MEPKGYILQAQPFSVNDGDGIRTTVFLSGCPLRCQWCANPEGLIQMNRAGLRTELCTKEKTVEELVEELKAHIPFFRRSGGGVTFSGGEPMQQLPFLKAVAGRLYDMGISMAIETCGFFDWEKTKDVLVLFDLIFIDCKLFDRKKHLQFTGQSNDVILDNMKKLGQIQVPVVVRIPVIEGVNADQKNMEDTAGFLKEYLPEAKLELLPYHTYGDEKYEALDLPLPPRHFGRPTEERLGELVQTAERIGISVVSYT